MAFVNWYDLEQIARERNRRENHRSYKTKPAPRSKSVLIIPALILLSMTAFYISNQHITGRTPPLVTISPLATSVAMVYVTPGNMQQLTVGTTFTLQVKVANMPQFNGWDIEIWADPAVLNATGLSITGNDFAVNASSGTPFEIVHCVNGQGSGCTSSDGLGIAHSAYGNNTPLTGNGLLFTVTFKVIGSPYTRLALQNDLISDPSSGNGVSHATLSGTYGSPASSGSAGGTHPFLA